MRMFMMYIVLVTFADPSAICRPSTGWKSCALLRSGIPSGLALKALALFATQAIVRRDGHRACTNG